MTNVSLPLIPLGLRQLWHSEPIPSLWCERAVMPLGTTFAQLDGRSIVPENPGALEKFLLGRALAPAVSKTVVVPLAQWPSGLDVKKLVSSKFVRRILELGLVDDPEKVITLTFSDFLSLNRFGLRNAISFGCEVEAGVSLFLDEGIFPQWSVVKGLAGRQAGSAQTAGNNPIDLETSVPALVNSEFGEKAKSTYARFNEPGWAFQGKCDIQCLSCDSPNQLLVYRKPYTTTQGPYKYWAIVCLFCKRVNSLNDFDAESKKAFRKWDLDFANIVVESKEFDLPSANEVLGGDLQEVVPEEVELDVIDSAHLSKIEAQPIAEGIELDDYLDCSPFDEIAEVEATVVAAARIESEACSGQDRQVEIGRAHLDEFGQLNLYRVIDPLIDLSEQPPGELFLAISHDSKDRYPVQVGYASATEIVLTSISEVPVKESLHLYLRSDPGLVAKAFLDFLEACKSPGFASVLAGHGQLSIGAPEILPGLNTEQEIAAGAIIAPGVSVVWGPPGTGKTRVIGAAIAELLRRGHSVALVSNTNVAVDQALLNVCNVAEPFAPGEILRVGHPTLSQVSEHPKLLCSRVIQLRFKDLINDLEKLKFDLNLLQQANAADGQLRLDKVLKGFNTLSLQELVSKQIGLAMLIELEARASILASQILEFRVEWERAGKRYDEARERSSRWAGFIGILEDEREVAALTSSQSDIEMMLALVARQVEDSQAESWLKRKRLIRKLESQQRNLEVEKSIVVSQMEVHLGRINHAAGNGVSPEGIRLDQIEEIAAQNEWRKTKQILTNSEELLGQLEEEMRPLSSLSKLSEREVVILGHIESFGSVKNLVDAARVDQKISADREDEIQDLVSRKEAIERQLHDLEATLISEANVIGTTLAQLVLHRTLLARTFDYVIIDEASASLSPYVYAAMSKARIGCTLVGDFEQNWPISNSDTQKLSDDIGRWLTLNPFGLVGIKSPADALSSKGCAVLRTQYRFGEQTMRLANAIAYGGLLRHGRSSDEQLNDDHEIVIIDTSGLVNGAIAEKGPQGSGRWWAAGAAISFHLSKMHGFQGVGIVSPYRRQVQLTQSQLNDGGGRTVQVGTAHSFQGREFPVVIFDLVEDGSGISWVAKASRVGNKWQREGSRLFNVATTRNGGRLYVIVNFGSILAAKVGPLRELKKLVDAKSVSIWDAREVLEDSNLAITPKENLLLPSRYDPPEILNDRNFYEALNKDLIVAENRVVIFSPFVASRRLKKMLPVLIDLIQRNVKVTVFTKDSSELFEPDLLTELRRLGINVKERQGMHEKIVIVDHRITYLGSLNVLSNNGSTDEIMLRLIGEDTNKRIAQWMKLRV